MTTTASLLDVAHGSIVGHSLVTVVGRRTDIGASEADVWSGGESAGTAVRVPPSSAGAMSIVSSSTDDDDGGTGARSVEIDYLDANYDAQTVVVTMDGTTPVVTTVTAIRVQRARVKTAGSGRINAGAVSVSVGGALQAHVPAGLGESPQALYTVPRGYYALLLREWAESASAGTGRLYTRGPAADDALRAIREHRTTAPHGGSNARGLQRIDQKTDVMLRASIDTSTGHVVAGIELLLVAL